MLVASKIVQIGTYWSALHGIRPAAAGPLYPGEEKISCEIYKLHKLAVGNNASCLLHPFVQYL